MNTQSRNVTVTDIFLMIILIAAIRFVPENYLPLYLLVSWILIFLV